DIKLYLQDNLLVKVDRMSMAHSLEVRVPFLDHELVEFTARIPNNLKVKGLQLKYILRKAFANQLPSKIASLPKKGFDIPLDDWIRGPLREFVTDILTGPRLSESGFLRREFVESVLQDHLNRRGNHRQLLWPIVVFEYWRQQYASH
ncbi:MAG: asparagine synthase C-terminal domain-containing protein, partial [Planctomycetota bacterium]